MKFIKKFEQFKINEEAEPAAPVTKPKPGTKPNPSKPHRPSPIRRDKPSVTPKPKAKKATAEQVAERFITELKKKKENIKNYLKK